MANGLSFSLLKFVVRGLSDRRPCLLTMCLGLCFFRAAHCCNVRRISPRRPKLRRNPPLPRPQSVSSLRLFHRRLKKVPLCQRNCHKPGKLRGMERNIKGSRRPVEQFMIKRGLQPHIQAYHSVARSRLLISPTENRWK